MDKRAGGDFAWRVFSVALALVYMLSTPDSWQCEGVDEIEYLGLAHSIERGEGYTLYGEPYPIYPPAYAALLSVIMRWDVAAWRPMYAVNALLGFVGLWYLANELRRRGGRRGGWAAWFALFAYYPWSFSTRYLMADPLFALLGSVAVVHASRALADGHARTSQGVVAVVGAGLASLAKASAVALNASLVIAFALAARLRRSRRALALACAIGIVGFGLQGAWELYAKTTAPAARESYTRWALKYLGLSGETDGLVAQSMGEGLEAPVPLPVRAVILMTKTGQYVLSMARVPPNFEPLGILIFTLMVVGMVRVWRRDAASPMAWYVALSLPMIALTSWVSSYHRYLYPLTPLLLYFLFEGLSRVRDLLASPRRNTVLLLLIAFGLFGFGWTLRGDGTAGLAGFERRYMKVTWMACANMYLFTVAIALGERMRGARPWMPVPDGLLKVALVALALHAGAIGLARHAKTSDDATPQRRNLVGAIACSTWVKQNTPESAVVQASLPRLVAFLCDRTTVAGGVGAGYLVLTGPLDVPAFRAADEARLKALVDERGLTPVYASGDAAVYTLESP
jgi:hypothetical protein